MHAHEAPFVPRWHLAVVVVAILAALAAFGLHYQTARADNGGGEIHDLDSDHPHYNQGTDIDYEWWVDDSDSTDIVQCSLRLEGLESDWRDCDSGNSSDGSDYEPGPLAEGIWVFCVRVWAPDSGLGEPGIEDDERGDVDCDSFHVDRTPPDALVIGPLGPLKNPSFDFDLGDYTSDILTGYCTLTSDIGDTDFGGSDVFCDPEGTGPLGPLSPGDYEFCLHVFDEAFNEAVKCVSFTVLPNAAPDTILTVVPPAKSNNPNPYFRFRATDDSDAIGDFDCWLNGTPVPCSNNLGPLEGDLTLTGLSDGLYTFEVGAEDVESKDDPTKATWTFRIDTTKPVVTAVVSPAPNGNGWHNGPVVITFTCSDPNGSGIMPQGTTDTAQPQGGNSFPPSKTVSKQGTTVFALDPSWRCVDMAGNVADPPPGFPMTIKIDTKAPVCRVLFTPGYAKGANAVVKISSTSTDTGGSGVASTVLQSITPITPTPGGLVTGAVINGPVPQNVTFQGAIARKWKVTLLATDLAGNTTTCVATLNGRN